MPPDKEFEVALRDACADAETAPHAIYDLLHHWLSRTVPDFDAGPSLVRELRRMGDENLAPEAVAKFLLRWTDSRPVADQENSSLRHSILIEAAALLTHPKFREAAWRFYRDLATQASEQESTLQIELTSALFEIIAEPPWIPDDVELLFTLLDSPQTRWAVFAAYERYPRTFRRHISLYGSDRVSDEEFADWLRKQGLVFTDRGLRYA